MGKKVIVFGGRSFKTWNFVITIVKCASRYLVSPQSKFISHRSFKSYRLEAPGSITLLHLVISVKTAMGIAADDL